ncbi:Pentatricopeptide repeat-containing protein [Zancudomyces culisetae]|uniref:Pentatricopeptide repeat-containing protein n=1 Tax=Zancudomyces culisetae TaxID=1213189 RepID=A0A1R1PVI8_ZANCU|nr:Pentatricopeptide repeat-containing protein [Zancudomyces culisetae]|eukprot:OMH84985.1 Pentatricopeptide repeat-containing protein [Zancudomyces culisetae]
MIDFSDNFVSFTGNNGGYWRYLRSVMKSPNKTKKHSNESSEMIDMKKHKESGLEKAIDQRKNLEAANHFQKDADIRVKQDQGQGQVQNHSQSKTMKGYKDETLDIPGKKRDVSNEHYDNYNKIGRKFKERTTYHSRNLSSGLVSVNGRYLQQLQLQQLAQNDCNTSKGLPTNSSAKHELVIQLERLLSGFPLLFDKRLISTQRHIERMLSKNNYPLTLSTIDKKDGEIVFLGQKVDKMIKKLITKNALLGERGISNFVETSWNIYQAISHHYNRDELLKQLCEPAVVLLIEVLKRFDQDRTMGMVLRGKSASSESDNKPQNSTGKCSHGVHEKIVEIVENVLMTGQPIESSFIFNSYLNALNELQSYRQLVHAVYYALDVNIDQTQSTHLIDFRNKITNVDNGNTVYTRREKSDKNVFRIAMDTITANHLISAHIHLGEVDLAYRVFKHMDKFTDVKKTLSKNAVTYTLIIQAILSHQNAENMRYKSELGISDAKKVLGEFFSVARELKYMERYRTINDSGIQQNLLKAAETLPTKDSADRNARYLIDDIDQGADLRKNSLLSEKSCTLVNGKNNSVSARDYKVNKYQLYESFSLSTMTLNTLFYHAIQNDQFEFGYDILFGLLRLGVVPDHITVTNFLLGHTKKFDLLPTKIKSSSDESEAVLLDGGQPKTCGGQVSYDNDNSHYSGDNPDSWELLALQAEKKSQAQTIINFYKRLKFNKGTHALIDTTFSTLVIKSMLMLGQSELAIKIFYEMGQNKSNSTSNKPNIITYSTLLNGLSKTRDVDSCIKIFNDLVNNSDFSPTIPIYTAMYKVFLTTDFGQLNMTYKNALVNRDESVLSIEHINILMSHAYSQYNHDLLISLFRKATMLKEIEPNTFTLYILFKSYITVGNYAHKRLDQQTEDFIQFSSLGTHFLRSKLDATKLPHLNYDILEHPDHPRRIYEYLVETDFPLDSELYNLVLDALSVFGDFAGADIVYNDMVKYANISPTAPMFSQAVINLLSFSKYELASALFAKITAGNTGSTDGTGKTSSEYHNLFLNTHTYNMLTEKATSYGRLELAIDVYLHMVGRAVPLTVPVHVLGGSDEPSPHSRSEPSSLDTPIAKEHNYLAYFSSIPNPWYRHQYSRSPSLSYSQNNCVMDSPIDLKDSDPSMATTTTTTTIATDSLHHIFEIRAISELFNLRQLPTPETFECLIYALFRDNRPLEALVLYQDLIALNITPSTRMPKLLFDGLEHNNLSNLANHICNDFYSRFA